MGCKCETLWCRWHADSLFTFFDHSTQGSQIQAPVHEWLCICNLLLVWCGRDLAIVLARSSNTCNYPSVIIYLKINSKSQHRPFRRVNIMDVVSWHTVAFSYLQCCFLVPVCVPEFQRVALLLRDYTARFFYCCPEHRSCHGMSGRMQVFSAIQLPAIVATVRDWPCEILQAYYCTIYCSSFHDWTESINSEKKSFQNLSNISYLQTTAK